MTCLEQQCTCRCRNGGVHAEVGPNRIRAHAQPSRARRLHRSSASVSLCSSNSAQNSSSMRQPITMRKEALLCALGAVLTSPARIQHVEAFVSFPSASKKCSGGYNAYRRRTTSTSFLTSTRESSIADGDDRNMIGDNDGMRPSTMMEGGSFSFGETLPSSDRIGKSKSLTTTTSGIRYGPPPAASDIQNSPTESGTNTNKSLLERLTSLSTFASALCVLDCTILPLITIALPLLGLTAAGSSALAHTLHHLGHTLALYFVLPVGTFTTTVAYANHRSAVKCLPGILGLVLVYLANAGGASVHLHTATVGEMTGGLNPLVQMVPHDVLHAISDGDGWIHRAVNILGCALMLGGNWWSKRTAGENGAEGGGGGVGGGACFVPGCGRIECEVDGEGMDGIDEVSFFRLERPNSD